MQPLTLSPSLPRLSVAIIAAPLLLALVALADLSIWQVSTPRLSLAVLALTIAAATHLLAGGVIGRRAVLLGWGGMSLAVLPVIEEVQALSVLFLTLGLSHAAGWFVAGSEAGWATALRAGMRLCWWSILRTLADLIGLGRAATSARVGRAGLARLVRDWAMPLGLGGLFVLLLISANPLLEVWSLSLSNWTPQFNINLGRCVFWLAMAAIIWPFLRLAVMRPKLIAPASAPIRLLLPEILLNPRSVLRALLTFNLIFALQTGLDLTYLWGGVSLPEGMTYAVYAHKGAYPLVVTALLAGGFALIAQPFLPGQPVLRALLFLWTVQNILLVLSAILRLDLYVETYGLTRLRFAAFIWMGLVVVGLILMIWQVWRGKTVGWLFGRSAMLGLATLYICCFINVAGLVASHNLARPNHQFDTYYLCTLGPGAIPAITRAEAVSRQDICHESYGLFIKAPQDLREWGYRNYRLRNSLAAMAAPT